MSKVNLPSMEMVADWLERNKPQLHIHTSLENRPGENADEPQIPTIIITTDFDLCLKVLLMKFCIALRKDNL